MPAKLRAIDYTKEYSLNYIDQNARAFDMISAAIPAGSIVMIPLSMTTWWTTYFPHYIIGHVFDFVLPPNIDQTGRKDDIKEYYADPTRFGAADILVKWKVDYVVFNTSELKSPIENDFLSLVTRNPFIHIYKVNHEKINYGNSSGL